MEQKAAETPILTRRDSSHLPPPQRESITSIPVTPGIGVRTYSAEGQSDYFPDMDGSVDTDHVVIGKPKVHDGGQTLAELRAMKPELALSGHVISVTFNIPYQVKYHKGQDWELKPRRGQSAMFDSFAYLSSGDSQWTHTVLSWTGEIDAPSDEPTPPTTPPSTVRRAPLNSLSAPVPIDGAEPPPTPPLHDGLWIPREDMERLEHQLAHKNTKTVAVWLADDADGSDEGVLLKDQTRWRRFAERYLYGLFHYKLHEPSDGRKERVQWANYYRMNQKFANKVIEHYKPGDVVVIYDFYLMLLPSMLRQRAPHMYIAYYLSSPFPSSEFLRCLPRRKEVLEGVLGSNLVAFQSENYSRHFTSSCERILGFKANSASPTGIDAYGARVEVGEFPVGIDAEKVESLAWRKEVDDKYRALKDLYAGKKLIVGRDRLDSVRGVTKKLEAFERFLEMFPEWRGKVVLIQVTSSSSTGDDDDDENKATATRVNELVMRINGLYGSLSFSPVQHYPQYISQDEYLALLRAGDIGLITSVRDGMSTTSLEYVVCQRDNAGPLILSEFSGTAGMLQKAIHINPWDLSGVAESIEYALTMSDEERVAREKSLLEHVRTHNVQHWVLGFLRKLVDVLAHRKDAVVTPLLDRAALLRRYRAAQRRVFMFDYDGTLTPIVREPSAAVPSERVIKSLKALAADHRNAVWIISGRDQDFLSRHLGHIEELGFSAEHGSFMRHPGSTSWENLAEQFDMGWQVPTAAVFQKYTDQCPGSFIERKRCALTWHYRQADPELGLRLAEACHRELAEGVAVDWAVEVMKGKANLEVRPTFINKGEIAKRLVATYNADARVLQHQGQGDSGTETPAANKIDFVLCMGDDFTDEDMFRALNTLSAAGPDTEVDPDHCFTVTVGASTKVTLARWHLLEPEDVIECVGLLAGAGAGAGAAGPMSDVNLAAVSAVDDRIPDGVEEA